MNPNYRKTHFLTSAAKPAQAPPDRGYEAAFAGRSNAGKSCALNALCDQKGLARTSKTPGRTQLLNFFAVDDERRLVDLPGYGYAKVSEGIKREWQLSMGSYLETRDCLKGVILVMDIRNPLKEFDLQMLDWSGHFHIPCHILLTKADKLTRNDANKTLIQVKKALTGRQEGITAQLFSALKKQGIDEAHALLDKWLEMPEPENA
ncbi:MAG: ribosome biogenesis GTP-binding protein YihA/YsxC [Gammaproteobacteria bacterium]|nr:ribosome biogenesis GTP-binding protein YihA/YsxC [Gammaproteobacteria bacterium]MBU1656310.1 ribosome biogenesis GTP-binding protein YihA/YsxC [Gammaproteobacteria bacterium]MBU1959875.1 ribosome biogenesis GTP-binding protein YihA/YsxC [Gammaproteobacteria bacterium]